jgi:hypothetical protein
MRKQLLLGLTFVSAVLTTVVTARADYSNTVESLAPVAYWPLNETVQPPAAYVATNSGTLGAAGGGYYETWFNPVGNGYNAQMDWTGPVAGATSDGDGAASFNKDYKTYILIPHTDSRTVIKAPFTVECWANTIALTNWANLIGGGGQYGNNEDANGDWAGFSLAQYNGSWLFDLYNTNGNNSSIELNVTATANQWTHLVATFDGTNAMLYVNGTEAAVGTPHTNSAGLGYVPDPVNPIQLGILNAAKYVNAYQGTLDEVAIYTNVLSSTDIANHYNAATAGGYFAAVTNDNPIIYLRLDEPLYNLPASNTFASFPAANSYGSIGSAANGLYQPGTVPGMPGPTGTGFGAANYSVAINGQDAAVDVGNGNLTGAAPALNVTGTNALSVVAWFKGNPADGYNRFQSILGHSDSGWRFGFGSSGPQFNPGGGGEISSSDIYNDGRWHMVAGVYSGTTNYIYVDGALITSTAYSGSQSGSARDVLLGGAPDYTGPLGNNRTWDGSLAQVAFFTNALSAASVLQLYTVAAIFPFISTQPTSATVNQGVAYTNTVTVGGSPTLGYQWYQNNSPVTDQTNLYLGYNPVLGREAGSYYLVVTNDSGAVTSSVVTLNVNTSPQITQQPATNYILFTGGSATLAVSAVGALPLSYYWYSNSVLVADSTNAAYVIADAQASATYSCLVSNFLGTVPSSFVSLTVTAAPTNAYPQAVLANNPIAYWRLDEPDDGLGDYNAGVVAHDYWGGHNGIYTNAELGQAGYPANPSDPDTAVLVGDIAASDSDVYQIPGIDFGTPNGGNAALTVETWVNAPTGQTDDGGIITKGTGGGGEQFNLDTGADGGTTPHAFRFFVRDASGGVHLANSTVLPDGNWHHLVGVCDEANGNVLLYVDGVLAGSTTITPGSGLQASANPISIGSRQSASSGSYDAQFYGIVDEVAIYNYALTPAQVSADYYAALSVGPAISQSPVSTTVNAGTTATFTVSASGTQPLAYQWYDVTAGFPGTPLDGQTGSTLTLTDVSSDQNGNMYAVVITNSFGQATSAAAELTVQAGPPVVETDIQPASVKAFVGTSVTFSIGVDGSLPFHYQWYQDSNPVGANADTYTAVVPPGTNFYYCIITNNYGPATSSVATVTGVFISNSGTNGPDNDTTFAINFMDAANAAYTADNGNTWTNVVFQGLGAYPDDPANTNWNGFGMFPNGYSPSFDSTVPPQVASDGTLTPITLTLTYVGDNGALGYGPGYDGPNTGQGEPSLILGQAAIVNGSTPTGGINLSNVPPGTYMLYLFGANYDGTRGASFSFASGSALGGTNATANPYTDGGSGPLNSFIYGQDYVIFTNVVPDANGAIIGTWGEVNNNGNSGEGDFNGLQLIRVSGPPVSAPLLSIQVSGANAIVTWNPAVGTLQSSTNVAGPYSDLGTNSPATNAITGSMQFFRVQM